MNGSTARQRHGHDRDQFSSRTGRSRERTRVRLGYPGLLEALRKLNVEHHWATPYVLQQFGPEAKDAVPDAPDQSLLGIHLRKQGQRTDHLAYRYLDDPAGFWRICEMNDAMLPETLTEAREIEIPRKVG